MIDVITGTPTFDFEYKGIIQSAYQIKLNEKSISEKIGSQIFGSNDEDFNTGLSRLKSLAKELGGDIVFDMRISTTTATFSNGTFLYTTLIATVGKSI